MIGQTISHYKITEKLGEGGMGVVYKAEDTRLERTVALKFLASHLLEDEEGCARFIREAKAAASLDHQNICTVYEIDDAGERTFIAMAFIEGLTVKDKIAQRPLKLDQALDIAVQTVQGLQAAHEKGIVHRDIKGANIMVTPPGQVKIMDFGLAQLAERSRLTETATLLGTPSYMSPEQAVGEKTDRRTDLWSIGVVLYEMIAGRLPFVGERQEAVLYGISSEEPEPVTAQRAGLPMELEWIIGKALAKDRNERYQHAEDLLVDLRSLQKKLASGKSSILKAQAGTQTVATQPAQTAQASAGPLARYRVIEDVEEAGDAIKYVAEDTELHRSVAIRVLPQSSAEKIERAQRRKQTLLLGTTALAVLLALIFAFFPLFAPTPVAETSLRRFTLQTDGAPIRLSISPNGRHVAYLSGSASERILWVQDLDQNEPRAIVGPARINRSIPFWSPDSQFVGFRSEDSFRKVAVSGGPVVTLAEATGFSRRSTWTPDGESVIFTSGGKLFRVDARGGKAELWLEAEQEGFGAYEPAFFSAGEGTQKLLYVEAKSASEAQIIALDRASGQREILAAGFFPVYDPSGHVIYQSIDPVGIWAVPFSVDTMKATGNPFPISENSYRPSIALDGTLVYLEGPAATGLDRLVWRDREGNPLGTIGQPQNGIRYPNLSPDGRKVAVTGTENGNQDIWIHEVDRPVKINFTTDEDVDLFPTWSPSGDRIAFSSGRTGDRTIYIKRTDGSGEPAEIVQNPEFRQYLTDWSPDERTLLFFRHREGATEQDLWYLERKEDGNYEEVPLLQTSANESTAKFSPDGRFVAYRSDRTGQDEVFVCTFPECRNQQRVSVNGGSQPRWRKDGKELFYVEGDSLMAVRVSTDPTLSLGSPQKLFSSEGLVLERSHLLTYDVTPDGERFVLAEPAVEGAEVPEPTIRVVQNWFAEFRDRQ